MSNLNILESSKDFYSQKRRRSEIAWIPGENKLIIEHPTFFSGQDAKAGDILLTNSDGTENNFTTPENYKRLQEEGKIGDNGYTPIGVCAVPASLTRVGEGGVNTGKARVVSLANMSLRNPEKGGGVDGRKRKDEGDTIMYWGDNTKVLGIESRDGTDYLDPITMEAVKFTTENNYMSTRLFSTCDKPKEVASRNLLMDKTDPYLPTNYRNRYEIDSTYKLALSSYGRFGRRYFTGFSSSLKGKETNDLILSKVTVNWQEGEIENSVASGHCPTVCSCRRYHTKGTQAGDWYLPTIGELGIMWARLKEINRSFYLLERIYAIPIGTGQIIVSRPEYDYYFQWLFSCTEITGAHARTVDARYGYTASPGKHVPGAVRAFLAIE